MYAAVDPGAGGGAFQAAEDEEGEDDEEVEAEVPEVFCVFDEGIAKAVDVENRIFEGPEAVCTTVNVLVTRGLLLANSLAATIGSKCVRRVSSVKQAAVS